MRKSRILVFNVVSKFNFRKREADVEFRFAVSIFNKNVDCKDCDLEAETI